MRTMLWITLVLVVVFAPFSDMARYRKTFVDRVAAGSPIKVGPVEVGELKRTVEEIKGQFSELSERVSDLFLVTLASPLYDNLKKLAKGNFGSYKMLGTGKRSVPPA